MSRMFTSIFLLVTSTKSRTLCVIITNSSKIRYDIFSHETKHPTLHEIQNKGQYRMYDIFWNLKFITSCSPCFKTYPRLSQLSTPCYRLSHSVVFLFFLPFLSFSLLHCQQISFHLNHHSNPNHIIFIFDPFEDQICKIPSIILLISSFSLIPVFQTSPKTITSCSPHLFTSEMLSNHFSSHPVHTQQENINF